MLQAAFGTLAVELQAGAALPRALLERPAAQALANALAAELARHLGQIDGLGLCWMAGCYDSAQLLRPGWPLWSELEHLYRAGLGQPDQQPQVLTLCARRGQAPGAVLEPERQLLGPGMVQLPFALLGPAERLQAAQAELEARLLGDGLVDARTARLLVDALDAPVEHARLLTRDDLCAITAANLEHAGLASLWQVLEAVLFAPQRVHDIQAVDALDWSVIDTVAHLKFSTDELDEANPASRAAFVERLLLARQALTLLDAHQVGWRILPNRARGSSVIEQDPRGYWIEWHGEPATIRALTRVHDAAGPLLWLELLDADGRVLGHGLPLGPAGYAALRQRCLAAGAVEHSRQLAA